MSSILKPQLTESNVKYFINSTLSNCHDFKEKYFNNIFNITLFIGLILFIFIVLSLNYKGNKDTKQIELEKARDKQYIIQRLLKLKQENIDDRRMRNNLITNLPIYNQN